jgi:integrase
VNGKRSLDHAKRRIDLHLAPVFGGRRMAGISTADVRAFIAARLDANAAPGEVNRELSLIKRMYTLAIQAGKLLTRPYVPMLAENNVRTGFFDREQFDSVIRHLAEAVRPVVTFAHITGWRIPSEVLSLQWRQVDLDAGTVRLDPGSTKSGEGRVIHVTADLRTLLESQRTLRDAYQPEHEKICPWVFHRHGQRIRSFRASWQSACRLAGCPGRIPHDLRRTAVRNLVRAGVPERVAMKVTGHKTRSVFDRYDITSPGDLRDAGAKLHEARNATGTITGTLAKTGTA